MILDRLGFLLQTFHDLKQDLFSHECFLGIPGERSATRKCGNPLVHVKKLKDMSVHYIVSRIVDENTKKMISVFSKEYDDKRPARASAEWRPKFAIRRMDLREKKMDILVARVCENVYDVLVHDFL
jgi:hypothetical protein